MATNFHALDKQLERSKTLAEHGIVTCLTVNSFAGSGVVTYISQWAERYGFYMFKGIKILPTLDLLKEHSRGIILIEDYSKEDCTNIGIQFNQLLEELRKDGKYYSYQYFLVNSIKGKYNVNLNERTYAGYHLGRVWWRF